MIWTLLSAYFFFRAEVSVEPANASNLKSPFDATFNIVNQWPLAVYTVWPSYKILSVSTDTGGALPTDVGLVMRAVRSLEPHGKFTGSIPYYHHELRDKVTKATLEVQVIYRPKFWPFQVVEGYRFTAFKKADGTFDWLSSGKSIDKSIRVGQPSPTEFINR